jgi:hypothetical protein
MWSGVFMLEESLHVVDPGVSAGLFPPDGEVVDNSIQQ